MERRAELTELPSAEVYCSFWCQWIKIPLYQTVTHSFVVVKSVKIKSTLNISLLASRSPILHRELFESNLGR